ncbi:hypothetical protein [Salinibacterium sp. SWN1162]|uniref:hypothetical protein n=1 Tax=Salinibacterium sp. SWN1162 TaxID=2792053 RepID=UPI0018CF6013|nr:hypothetical protein [Salinibacterium sp. SWN1162]MBH0010122.1 hypothetical protein [Salinibacterium sp. SWN1162]
MVFDVPPLSLMPIERLTRSMEDRAWKVQTLLADHGKHRERSVPGLVIATTAENVGFTLLAVDKDFDLIAAATGHLRHCWSYEQHTEVNRLRNAVEFRFNCQIPLRGFLSPAECAQNSLLVLGSLSAPREIAPHSCFRFESKSLPLNGALLDHLF